jgi:tetratricopeptide (TPR) repeat protein
MTGGFLMIRRYLFPLLASAALIISTAIFANAQTGQLRGHVVLKQADGTKVPAPDIAIDVYRIDLVGKYNTKTDKKGVFVFAGLPFVGTYVITASGPGAQPAWIPGVKAGREIDYEIEMSPGDGRRYSADDVKQIIAQGKGPAATGGTKESAEEKAKREELEKKNAEIMASNRKAEESNATVQRTFKAGNEAVKAKNFDEAIALFDEGIKADPTHPGAPSLMTNRASALNSRAVSKYNTAVQSTDEAAKTSGIDAAKKDWREAFETSKKAVEMLKAAEVPTDATAANNAKINLHFALAKRAEIARFFVTKVDSTQADAGVQAYEDFIAVETDPVIKTQAQRELAQMLFDAGALSKAQVQYEKILEKDPNDADSLARMGMLLFNIGATKEQDGKMDEANGIYLQAANYLQQFVDKVPDSDTLKSDAKATLEYLQSEKKIKAEKTPTTRRRRP